MDDESIRGFEYMAFRYSSGLSRKTMNELKSLGVGTSYRDLTGEKLKMFKRLCVYFRERYPLFARLILGMIVFGEIYFIILLNYGVLEFNLGMQEVTGAYTVFAFLLWLRIADDLKDFETDKRLFPDRPLASGRVYKKDIIIACVFFQAIAIILNIIFIIL